ncbi:expressed unknown protein [Seminavis robusta]|uniref:Uncharacterized protein n=1 Tax=Seminavis robusta TaxID=568900 RepID=A0A9N8E118_9STRA|nr:expressed unknown protein [Seminavis robusta]|eukprot:Sro542_g163380.1 n/a (1639) ;mRNA; r:33997-40348
MATAEASSMLLSAPMAPAEEEKRTYEDVGFKEWDCQGGTLKLHPAGLIYHEPSPGSRMLKVRWQKLCRPIATSAMASDLHCLKMKSTDPSTVYEYCFTVHSVDALERLRLDIIAYQENHFHHGSQSRTSGTRSTHDDPLLENVFFGINCKKELGGRLVLREREMLFVTSYEKELLSIPWQSIKKVQINSLEARPLVRIVDGGKKSFTFEMTDKSDLERLRENIKNLRLASEPPKKKEEVTYTNSPQKKGLLSRAERGGLRDSDNLKTPMISQRHGSGRELEKSRGFGSYPLLVGPAADLREMEYVSALHQSSEPILRSDGTISSKDIIPYLMSRYGIQITNEQALDIASNICGAKFRNLVSEEDDEDAEERRKVDEELREVIGFGCCGWGAKKDTENEENNGGGAEEDEAEDEEILYFDLVQLASLLLIPELLQLGDMLKNQKVEMDFKRSLYQLRRSVAFVAEDKLKQLGQAKLSPNCDRVLLVVIESLIEVLDEETQEEIRNGRPLDISILQIILRSFGDLDGADDVGLIRDMLNTLCVDGGPPLLTPKNFIAALTKDVETYYGAKGSRPKPDRRTSTFFDIIGFNWDNLSSDERARALDPSQPSSLNMVNTSIFIDYASDVYRSRLQNTAAWCMFFFFILLVWNETVYRINFWAHGVIGKISHTQYIGTKTNSHGDMFEAIVVSPGSGDDNDFWAFVFSVVSWMLQALACGCFGFIIVLTTSAGNINGRIKRWLLLSIVSCGLLAVVGSLCLADLKHLNANATFKAEVNPNYCITITSDSFAESTADARRLSGIDPTCARIGADLISTMMTRSDMMTDLQTLPVIGDIVTELSNMMGIGAKKIQEITVMQLLQCSQSLSQVNLGETMQLLFDNAPSIIGQTTDAARSAASAAVDTFVNGTVAAANDFVDEAVNQNIAAIEEFVDTVVGNAAGPFADETIAAGEALIDKSKKQTLAAGQDFVNAVVNQAAEVIGDAVSEVVVAAGNSLTDLTASPGASLGGSSSPGASPEGSSSLSAPSSFSFGRVTRPPANNGARGLAQGSMMLESNNYSSTSAAGVALLNDTLNNPWLGSTMQDDYKSLLPTRNLQSANATNGNVAPQGSGQNATQNSGQNATTSSGQNMTQGSSQNATPSSSEGATSSIATVAAKIMKPLVGVPLCVRKHQIEDLLTALLNLDGNVTLFGITMDGIRALDYVEVVLEEAKVISVDRTSPVYGIWLYYMSTSLIIASLIGMVLNVKVFFMKRDNIYRSRDYKIKCAASHKVANLVENALSMHVVQGGSTKGQTMRNFFRFGEQVASVGGFKWNSQEVWSQKIIWKQGVWYSGRLAIGQAMQVVITIAGMTYGARMLKELHDGNGVPELGIANMLLKSGATNIDSAIRVAGTVGMFVGFLAAVYCISSYLPSYTKTVLYLRSGMLPSLHNPQFFEYRSRADDVVQNIGNMVFALMGASMMTALTAFFVLFICIFDWTREFVVKSVATVIGIGCTIGIKTVGQKLLRERNFSAFYRNEPRRANYFNLFFEAWYIGTGVLMVISRLVMFVVAGTFFIGRIDVDFFNADIRVFGANLDAAPVAFRRDILAHEAHLHPYIERLGSMYLARLRHGESFGSKAGTAWRCLFVTGLSPWSVKHRVNSREDNG